MSNMPNLHHVKSSTHCTLCRKHLPEPEYELDFVPPEDKAWEYEVLSFYNISPFKGDERITITEADFKKPETFKIASLYLCLESECSQCDGGNVAYIVHQLCWKVAEKLKISDLSFYKLARSIYPLFNIEERLFNEHKTLKDLKKADIKDLIRQHIINTDVANGLDRFLKLPIEIKDMISAFFVPNLMSSLHTVNKTMSRTTHRIIGPFFSATQTTIFDEHYISSVTFDNPGGVCTEDFRGIRFTIGPYGLRAISILDADGTTSNWLGDSTNGWTGVLYGNQIKTNLKYLQMEFNNVEANHIPASRVMWDKDSEFIMSRSHYILDTATSSQIMNFPGWRLCKYLPLVDDTGVGISGLTMYCNGHGVTGIEAHGQNDSNLTQNEMQIGRRQGCPIHFILQPDERVISIWLRVPADYVPVENEPCILVTTNHHRSCVFGPCLPQNIIQHNRYTWVSLTRSSNDVLGIFYDALAVRRCNRIANIGVSQNIKPQDFVAKDLPRIPAPQRRPCIDQDCNTGIYYSNGKLDQVKRLRICQVGPRYMGMLIDHYDGSAQVLGQWSYHDSSISEIYNEQDGVFSSVTFHLFKQGTGSYVGGIFVEGSHSNTPTTLQTEQPGVISCKVLSQYPVEWWFSRDYDEINSVETVLQKIHISTETPQVIALE